MKTFTRVHFCHKTQQYGILFKKANIGIEWCGISVAYFKVSIYYKDGQRVSWDAGQGYLIDLVQVQAD